jgi:Subtilase family
MKKVKISFATILLLLINTALFAQTTNYPDGKIGRDGEEVVIDDVRYVWRGGGLIVKNQKIIFLNSEANVRKPNQKGSYEIPRKPFNRDQAIRDVLNKFKDVKNLKIAKQCECNDLILLEGEGLENVNINTDPQGSSDNNGTHNRADLSNSSLNNYSTLTPNLKGDEPIYPKELCFPFEKKIAILDNGIETKELKNNNKYYTLADFGGTSSDIWGVNFTDANMNNDIKDYSGIGHGTKVANIITDIPNRFKMIPMKIIKGDNGTLFDAICAMLYAQKIGVDVINCSWGHNGFKNNLFEKVVKLLSTENITVICSAGNDNRPYADKNTTPSEIFNNKKTRHYPAMFANSGRNVINVTNNKTGNFGSAFTSCDLKSVNSPYNNLISEFTSYSCAYVTSLFLHKFDTYKNEWRFAAINGTPKLLKRVFYEDKSVFEGTGDTLRVENGRMVKPTITP